MTSGDSPGSRVPRGHLEQPLPRSVAVLLDEQQPSVLGQREERDRAGMHDGLTWTLGTVGEAQPRLVDSEERALVGALVAQDLGQLVAHAGPQAVTGEGRSSVIAISLQPGNLGQR